MLATTFTTFLSGEVKNSDQLFSPFVFDEFFTLSLKKLFYPNLTPATEKQNVREKNSFLFFDDVSIGFNASLLEDTGEKRLLSPNLFQSGNY